MVKAPPQLLPKPSTWALVFIYRIVSVVSLLMVALLTLTVYGAFTGHTRFTVNGPWLPFFFVILLYGYSLYAFWAVLRRAAQGRIFDTANAIGLRRIGACLAAAGLWTQVLNSILIFSPDGSFSGVTMPGKITLSTQLFSNEFGLSLIAFAFAEIFRQGYLVRQEELRLRAEQDLTV